MTAMRRRCARRDRHGAAVDAVTATANSSPRHGRASRAELHRFGSNGRWAGLLTVRNAAGLVSCTAVPGIVARISRVGLH